VSSVYGSKLRIFCFKSHIKENILNKCHVDERRLYTPMMSLWGGHFLFTGTKIQPHNIFVISHLCITCLQLNKPVEPCMEYVHTAHVHFRFSTKLLFNLRRLHGDLRVKALEILACSITSLDNVYQQLIQINFPHLLSHRLVM